MYGTDTESNRSRWLKEMLIKIKKNLNYKLLHYMIMNLLF